MLIGHGLKITIYQIAILVLKIVIILVFLIPNFYCLLILYQVIRKKLSTYIKKDWLRLLECWKIVSVKLKCWKMLFAKEKMKLGNELLGVLKMMLLLYFN